MYKNIAAQTAAKKAEQEKVIKVIQQLENRQKILLNKQRNEERKARTRRLIAHGAILEGVFPAVTAMTGEEAKAFLVTLSHQPGAAEIVEQDKKTVDMR